MICFNNVTLVFLRHTQLSLCVNTCIYDCVFLHFFSLSMWICVSQKYTYTDTHTEHHTFYRHFIEAKVAIHALPTYLHMPLKPSEQPVQMFNQPFYTFQSSSMASGAPFLLVLLTSHPLGIQE